MNERIEELAEEHGFIHEFMTTGERNDALQKYKKFAELIVQECVDRIKNADMTDLEGSDPDDVLWLVERQVVKHFGVD